jgi:hypothetical protein
VDAVVVDLQGIVSILDNAFVRVPHDANPRGAAFEDAFRELVSSEHFELLPQRHLRAANFERETDAAIRVGTTLYLFECRAMERPLDFERGRPKTIAYRNRDLGEKVSQVLSLADFIGANIRGENYDFSWAKRIVPLVVSPFVEWIWSRDPRLWLRDEIPRILSAPEAINLLKQAARMLPA